MLLLFSFLIGDSRNTIFFVKKFRMLEMCTPYQIYMWESFSEQPSYNEKKSTIYKRGKTFHKMKIFYQLTQSIYMTSADNFKGLLARLAPGLLSVFILQENYSDRKINLIIGILISTNFYCIA